MLDRHIADSLRIVPIFGAPSSYADLGSGAGFPGLVLAIATDTQTTLLEADLRKAAFLREAIRISKAPATVVAKRIEDINNVFETITARAVAPLSKLIGLVNARLAPNGRGLFLKGGRAAAEVTAARRHWMFDLVVHEDDEGTSGCILEVSRIAPKGKS